MTLWPTLTLLSLSVLCSLLTRLFLEAPLVPPAAVDILKGFSADPDTHRQGLQLFRQLLSGRPGRQVNYVVALLQLASGTPQEVRGRPGGGGDGGCGTYPSDDIISHQSCKWDVTNTDCRGRALYFRGRDARTMCHHTLNVPSGPVPRSQDGRAV